MKPTILLPSPLSLCLSAMALLVSVASPPAQQPPVRPPGIPLQRLLDSAVGITLTNFAEMKLRPDELAATVIDLRDPQHAVRASVRGDVPIYPASVVKLFYLAAAHRWMEDGKLEETPELRRAMRDMIVESYNEATHYIVDLLTDTTSGPELPETELDAWFEKRNAVNRYFSSMGYTNINANKKPWCEGPYGRESQSIRKHKPNRNLLTTDATARLLSEIATDRAVSADRCRQMKGLLQRDPQKKPAPGSEPDQAYDFSGPGLPSGAKLWSKAGWTSQTRHDAAYVELPDGGRLVLVIFTTGHANEREIIPTLVREVVRGATRSTHF
jgi:hypothetical protein